jgi:hypothetical protein
MNDTRQIIPIAGLVATFAMAAYMVIQLSAQTAAPAGDFRNAVMAEVHNAQGQPILRGQFSVTNEEDDDVERKARLESSGTDADATGEAEIEFPRTDPSRQELEFSVQKLEPGTALTFLIDGQSIGQATVDRQGRAEIEITVAGPASR